MEESRESTMRTTEHEHEGLQQEPPLAPKRRHEKPRYRSGADHVKNRKAEDRAPKRFNFNEPVIYRPSPEQALRMRIAHVDEDADGGLIYWLRDRDSGNEAAFYSDSSRNVEDPEVFQGSELERDSE